MTSSANKKNILVGAVITAAVMSAALRPAFASPFTDYYGNTCDTSQLGPGGPGGQSICPSSPQTPAQAAAEDMRRTIERVRQEEEDELDDLRDRILGPFWRLGAGVGNNTVTGGLGMYVSSNRENGDAIFGGGGYSVRNSGVATSDTAGLVAPGTPSASYRENGGGGGISGTYNASRFVGPNQTLLFNGGFDYTSSNTNFGGVGAGSSINSDNYKFKGIALYANYDTYLALTGSYQFGDNTEMSAGSTGSYHSDGYHIDAAVGQIFYFLNTLNTMTRAAPSRMALKAPMKPSDDGYAIGLDLTGHLGYTSDVARGFTDTSGFMFGDERVQGGETGLRAKLFALVQSYGAIWQPYVAGSVNWRFDYSHIANFPGQLALATGDAVTFSDATTFVGAKVGLDVKMTNGWTVGANGFYEHSSDTEIVGGKAYVKIPFGATAVTARY